MIPFFSGLLSTVPKLTKLIELHLGDCIEVDNEVVSSISKSCPNLSIFNLLGCKKLNDDCFDVLESLQLTALNISGTGVSFHKTVQTD